MFLGLKLDFRLNFLLLRAQGQNDLFKYEVFIDQPVQELLYCLEFDLIF